MSFNRAQPKSSAEFERRYGDLNPNQRRAVDAIEGPVMVIAGPGTGKTSILTLRIANILKCTDTAPDNILALTFTESGAFAMRRTLLDIIGPTAYKVTIHTFHGFAEHLIQLYPDYFPRIIGSRVVTDAEQLRMMEKIIDSRDFKVLRPYGNPTHYIKSILHEIQILKRENISPAELKKSLKKDLPPADASAAEIEKIEKRNEKNLELASAYAAYEEALADANSYDFDDMLLELIRTMETNGEFKLILQEAYQYILADEHQDANASQNRILELLADFHESPNLFIVGDDKQAVYRFQGASLENFLYFGNRYAAATVIDLTHNYRSHQGILDAAHSLIGKNPAVPGRDRARLIALQIGGGRIRVNEYETREQETDHIAVLIRERLTRGEKPEQVAVLYRENKNAAALSAALAAHGIPHRIESDYDILQTSEAVRITILCRAIHSPGDSEALAKALLLPELGVDPGEATEALGVSGRERKPLYEVIRHGPWKSLRLAYDRIKDWSGEAVYLPFLDLLQKLIQETGLIGAIVAAPDSLERLSSLEALFDELAKAAKTKKSFYLADFIDFIGVLKKHGLKSRRSFVDHVGGVRLMTAHRAKGLEFEHVYIVHAEDGVWGNRRKRASFSVPIVEHAHDDGRIEDERRLFYVALTRARESVTISYALQVAERDTMPSQFVEEIDPELVSFERPQVRPRLDVFAALHAPYDSAIPTAEGAATAGRGSAVAAKKPAKLPGTSILDADFIRSKFFSQPLSVTHLNNYLQCPWRYFFVNLIRIPQAETKHQMYGTAIHKALRTYFEAYRKGEDMSLKDLLKQFRYEIDRQPMSVDDRADSHEKGVKALTGYVRTYAGTWSRHIVLECAIRGAEITVGNDHLALTGKLDKIEFVTEKTVGVIDFKTSKPKSRNEIEGKTKEADGNYKRQLVFYKLLLDLEGPFDMRYGEIDFIEPNPRGIYKKERFEVTAAETHELEKTIAGMAEEIMDRSFVNAACGESDCEYCKLGRILKRSGNC